MSEGQSPASDRVTSSRPGTWPSITVLLPTHNRADVLPFAIESVLAQTISDFELLVVGDGCTDATAQVAEAFEDSRIRWFDLPKAPFFGYANRNLVMREARGRTIAMMSHDDLWFPDHLALLDPYFDDPAIDLVYSRPLWVSASGTIVPAAFNLNDTETLMGFLARKRNNLPSTCFVARTSAIEACGGFDESIERAGDLDLWARIISRKAPRNYAYVSTPTTLHFQADWRTDTNFLPPEIEAWQVFTAEDEVMPAPLRFRTPDGFSQQEAVWNTLKADGAAWAEEVRAAAITLLDHRVIESAGLLQERANLQALLKGYGGELAEQQSRREAADAQSAVLRKELDAAAGQIEHLLAAIAENAGYARQVETQVGELQTALDAQKAQTHACEARMADWSTAQQALERKLGYRALTASWRLMRRAFPPESMRGHVYARAVRAVDHLTSALARVKSQ